MSNPLSLCITSERWNEALNLCRTKPEWTRTWTRRSGFFEGVRFSEVLPIHEACANGAPYEVVAALVTAYPSSVQMKETAYKRLPIHIACRKTANIRVIELLLHHFSNGSLEPDTLGRLPLHYALSNGANDHVVALLLQCRPNSARGVDRRGWTPLHVACSVGASTHVVKVLLESYPEASVMATSKGSTAIHCMDSHQAGNKLEVTDLLARYRQRVDTSYPIPTRPISDVGIV